MISSNISITVSDIAENLFNVEYSDASSLFYPDTAFQEPIITDYLFYPLSLLGNVTSVINDNKDFYLQPTFSVRESNYTKKQIRESYYSFVNTKGLSKSDNKYLNPFS